MIYLIIHNRGHARASTHDWIGLHTERQHAIEAFELRDIDREDILSLIEIDPTVGTWRGMVSRYGANHESLLRLLNSDVQARLISQSNRLLEAL